MTPFLFLPIFFLNLVNVSDINIKNEAYTNTGEGGKSYSKVETVINGEKTVVESNTPGSLKVEIQKINEGKPTIIIEKENGEQVTVTENKKTGEKVLEKVFVKKNSFKKSKNKILNIITSFITALKNFFGLTK